MDSKVCTRCDEEKPVDKFRSINYKVVGKTYISNICKACHSKRDYINNRESYRIRSARCYRNNKEKYSADSKRRYLNNKEKAKESARRAKIKKPEHYRELDRAKAIRNRDALTDHYVILCLMPGSSLKYNDFKNFTELIELKRTELQIKRYIKSQENGSTKN